MSASHLRIAIIGAGPAGLTLGVLLQRQGIPFTIFELRQRFTDEELAQPAGSLDLHDESGLAALREAGLYDEFKRLIDDCTEAQRIANWKGEVIYTEDDDQNSDRPEISRHKLIKLLMAHLPRDCFRWHHKLRSARSLHDHGAVALDFGEQGTYEYDLVVGADGAWSKVRGLLTTEKPCYVGIQSVNLNLHDVSSKHPDLASLIGSGTFMALGKRHGVCAQRSVSDSARIYLFVSTADEHFAMTHHLQGATPSRAKHVFLDGDAAPFAQWGANLRKLVDAACEDHTAHNPAAEIDVKPLHKLPAGHTWQHHACATLVGDAAHLMNPPAGEGVNIAMLDALELSRAIIGAHASAGGRGAVALQAALDPLVVGFEAEMTVRARQMADDTMESGKLMFGGDDGAQALADWLGSFRHEEPAAEALQVD